MTTVLEIQKDIDEEYRNASCIGKLKRARRRYAGSFTVHGLSHIVQGSPLEKIFWILCVLGSLAGTIAITHHLFKSYLNHEVDTTIKIVPNARMQLPTIYICSKSAVRNLRSYRNCSSRRSKSYDSAVCNSLKGDCPEFCPNLQCKTKTGLPVICPPELFGQCISVNHNGKVSQEFAQGSIPFELPLSQTDLPVIMYVKPPGENASVIELLYDNRFIEIKRLGLYDVTIKKRTVHRCTPPYSKCLEEHGKEAEAKNIFRGDYSMEKCISSCNEKRTLNDCNVTFWTTWNLLKKQTPKPVEDKIIKKIEACAVELSPAKRKMVQKCQDGCKPKCFDQTYKATLRYQTNGEESLRFNIKMSMNELQITETEKYNILVVLSNFGGTLGLLAGVSALSLIELFVWFVLYVVEGITRLAVNFC